jgi:hypothetical protein
MRHRAYSVLLAGAVVALAGSARAQSSSYAEKKTADGQEVRFRDDPLSALKDDPVGAQVTAWHPPKRFDLMRPRKTFVPEMLRTIENM